MKKIINYLMMLALCCACCLSSCSDDENFDFGYDEDIIGTWQGKFDSTKFITYSADNSLTLVSDAAENASGTYSVIDEILIHHFTSYSANSQITTDVDILEFYYIVSLNATSLILAPLGSSNDGIDYEDIDDKDASDATGDFVFYNSYTLDVKY